MIGLGEQFGASARGLALNTTQFGHEEFPLFRQFWLQRPPGSADGITLWALLDSASAAGAFEFQIKPGAATVASVKATYFPRKVVQEFGIAPLTSMFYYDQNSHPPNTDFRPEVHDSDGLLLHTGADQFLWRPLESGSKIRVNSYLDDNPQGFGLMQRARAFDLYQDLVARYDLRPSVWVKPIGKWGRGRVQLVQLPSHNEYMDNIVAFWIPDHPPQAGHALELAYELQWLTNEVSSPQLGQVRATRLGQIPGGGPAATNQLRIIVDFGGRPLEALAATDKVDAEITCSAEARLVHHQVIKNEVNGTWRLVMELIPSAKPVDLRAVLTRAGRPITETWIWTWQP